MRNLIISLALVSSIAAAQPVPPAPDRLELASLGLEFIDVPEKKGDFFLAALDQGLTRHGIRVVSKGDVSKVLGFEQQKQMLGCSEESCLAELSAALGVDVVLTGQLAKLGGGFALSVKILDSRNLNVLATYLGRASDDETLLDLASTAAPRELAQQLKRSLKGAASAEAIELREPVSRDDSLRRLTWVPATIGAGLLVGAVVTQVLARAKASEVTQLPTLEGAQASRAEGQRLETASYLLGGGALVGAAVAAWFFASGDEAPAASLALTPDGLSLGIGGTF